MAKVGIITKITRAHITLDYGEKQVTVPGEAYLRGYGSPDFVASLSELEKSVIFDSRSGRYAPDLNQIKEDLTLGMQKRNMSIEFE